MAGLTPFLKEISTLLDSGNSVEFISAQSGVPASSIRRAFNLPK